MGDCASFLRIRFRPPQLDLPDAIRPAHDRAADIVRPREARPHADPIAFAAFAARRPPLVREHLRIVDQRQIAGVEVQRAPAEGASHAHDPAIRCPVAQPCPFRPIRWRVVSQRRFHFAGKIEQNENGLEGMEKQKGRRSDPNHDWGSNPRTSTRRKYHLASKWCSTLSYHVLGRLCRELLRGMASNPSSPASEASALPLSYHAANGSPGFHGATSF